MGPPQKLSKIRVRLLLGFVTAFVFMTLFGAFSYVYFARIEQRLVFLSHADTMLNTVLEFRRYEKNYFLYHHEKDYQQALGYLGEFDGLLEGQADHLLASLGQAGHGLLLANVARYKSALDAAHRMLGGALAGGDSSGELAAAIDGLRSAGQQIISGCEVLARQERHEIQRLLRQYRPVMIAFLLCLAALGAVAAHGLIQRLVRPLKVIEDAAQDVGRGQFRVIAWNDRRDEIGDVIAAFNHMVRHLRQNNEQMIQTEKLTSLGTLTSGVAHELNNPLNNISTSTQILLEELDSPSLQEYHRELLAAIEQQVAKAKDIVGSLLEFARQREFEPSRHDLRSVIDETLKLIKGEIPALVQVEVDAPTGIVMDMDKAHIVQALINLIINAIQAMDGAGRLSILARPAEGETVRLELADSGGGIAPEVLPRIFDPFFTTKEVGQGTGLGLSITYGIIERHHGHIQAESRPGQGARFIITLPLRAREA